MKHLYAVILLLTTLFLPQPVSGTEGESGFSFNRNRRSVTLPIHVRNNLAVMPLHINNRGPFYFILDTGVNTTILTEPMIAHLLGMNLDQSILIYGLGGEGIVEAALAQGVEISMRGITGRNMNMVVIPDNILSFSEVFGFPVYGIIGYDFLRHFAVEISYAAQTMRVYREPDYRIHRRSKVLPFRLINGKPYLFSQVVGSNGDTLQTHLLVDLGASHPLYLNKEYIGLSDNTITGFLGKGISGNLLGKMGRVEKLIMGDAYVKDPIVSYPDEEFLMFNGQSIAWEGIIGGGIIKRYNVIIDYPSEQMVLLRGQYYTEPFNTSLSGLEVIARGPNMRQFVVHYVRPGSAGYEAGIISGDRIVALNSKSQHQMTLEDILNALSGREGQRITMAVLREQEILRKDFRLREDL